MFNIVELRGKSNDQLEEMIENAREEMFNLRFQHATKQLQDVSRIRSVRREIGQVESVLRMRELAVERAAALPSVSNSLKENWTASAQYDYEEGGWMVSFKDEADVELANAKVDLNKKGAASNRRSRKLSGAIN